MPYEQAAKRRMKRSIVAFACMFTVSMSNAAERAASDNVLMLTEGDRETVVDALDDPVVEGVSCYISLSRIRPAPKPPVIGRVETWQTAISCRQAGALKFKRPLAAKEEVFEDSASTLMTKQQVRVLRLVDQKRRTLTYVTFPETAISSVAVTDQKIPLK